MLIVVQLSKDCNFIKEIPNLISSYECGTNLPRTLLTRSPPKVIAE